MKPSVARALAALAIVAGAGPLRAEVFDGVDFPQGFASFADAVVSYTPGSPAPTLQHMDPTKALGAPDYAAYNAATGNVSCPTQAECPYLSLGVGGNVVLRFIDNVLTGSDSAADDLYIFEIGPSVESTIVDISMDGIMWIALGEISGSTRGIDIDAFGYGSGSSFNYVRLTDVAGQGGTGGDTVGADIDAVGAISTRMVPEPATWAMMLCGFGLIGVAARRRADRSHMAG